MVVEFCSRTFATSSGVTAKAVTTEPTEEDIMRAVTSFIRVNLEEEEAELPVSCWTSPCVKRRFILLEKANYLPLLIGKGKKGKKATNRKQQQHER